MGHLYHGYVSHNQRVASMCFKGRPNIPGDRFPEPLHHSQKPATVRRRVERCVRVRKGPQLGATGHGLLRFIGMLCFNPYENWSTIQ
jgi:hypothetical protein